MRMLVLSPQPFFSPRGTPFSVYYRSMVAAELGAEIDLLTYGSGEDVDLPNVRIIRIPRIRAFEPIPIGPSIRKSVLDLMMIVWTVGLLLRRRYDIVHAHEESVFWARMLKRLFRFKLVYDMHSRLPRQVRESSYARSGLLVRAFNALEDASLREADGVITISPDLARYALDVMPDPHRHFLIENSLFEPIRLLHENGDGKGDVVDAAVPVGRMILYAGTFEPYQGIDLLIRAFSGIHVRHPDVVLLLAGGTATQVEHYRRLAEAEGVDARCHFTGTVPKAVIESFIRGAEVLVSPRRAGTSTPLKIYEQMASGRPLVATDIAAHTDVLSGDICYLVPPTVEGLATGLNAALADPERSRELAGKAALRYRENYARWSYTDKMRQLFTALT